MATEAGTARPGSVAMETTRELGLQSLGAPPAQNPAEPLCEAGAAVGAARWDLRKYSLLIVIGDIGTESQLRAVRTHLEQGEPLSWLLRSTPSVPLRYLHSSPSAHFCHLHLYVHFPKPATLSPASSMNVPLSPRAANILLVHPFCISHSIPQSPGAGGAPCRTWGPSGHTPSPKRLDHISESPHQTLKSSCPYLTVSSLGEVFERRVHISNPCWQPS